MAGWVKEFPRWVFPYWGFALLITLYIRNFTGTIAGYQVRGDWWAWIPLVGVVVVGSLWARGLRPVSALFRSVWRDWTLLSFAFYGALPLLFIAAYDEVHNEGLSCCLLIIMLILAAGAVIYMRTENVWNRFGSLVEVFCWAGLTVMIYQGVYWNGRQEIGCKNREAGWKH